MIQTIPAAKRHFTDFGWLKTYWLFSFSSYYDPSNISHGTLRVFNDDIVEPHTGFDTHPHEEMEIISVILEGEMTHKDTMGNSTVIRPGDIQRMTAGTGLYHSEMNDSDQPVHFYQIWIKPDTPGLPPSYDQVNISPEQWENKLALLASSKGRPGTITLNTDADLYRGKLDGDNSIRFMPEPARKQFIYLIDGAVTINSKSLNTNDQARVAGEKELVIKPVTSGEFILIDTPAEVSPG